MEQQQQLCIEWPGNALGLCFCCSGVDPCGMLSMVVHHRPVIIHVWEVFLFHPLCLRFGLLIRCLGLSCIICQCRLWCRCMTAGDAIHQLASSPLSNCLGLDRPAHGLQTSAQFMLLHVDVRGTLLALIHSLVGTPVTCPKHSQPQHNRSSSSANPCPCCCLLYTRCAIPYWHRPRSRREDNYLLMYTTNNCLASTRLEGRNHRKFPSHSPRRS